MTFDDPKIRELFKHFGGDVLKNDNTKITISGGFTLDNKHKEHSIVIGNISKQFIKNRIISWDSFKSVYYINNKLDPKYYDKLLNIVNEIIILPVYTVDENELLFLINNIYKAECHQIINGILKNINLYSPLLKSIQHLFMIYKLYIEKLIEKFVELRNEYIIHFKIEKNSYNKFNELTTQWNIIDAENGINTSSIILFFNFHPNNVKIEKSIPKIIWKINSSDKKHSKVNKSIDEFLDEIKKSKFEYIGYCPHSAIERFKILLKFPIDKLITMIKNIDYKNNNNNIDKLCDNTIKTVVKLTPKIEFIKSAIKPELNIKKETIEEISKFPKKTNIEYRIKYFETYINAFLALYSDITPHLIKKEKYINNLAIDINGVSNNLNEIINLV